MTPWDLWVWYRVAVWVIGVPVILWLLWRIVQRIRAIDRLDAEVRAEEEANAHNPYAAYARTLEAQQLVEEAHGKKPKESKKTRRER